MEECAVVCSGREKVDSEAEQCWEEEAENEGGNDGALAEEKHFEEWVGGKIGSWWKETKGVLLLLGARRKKMAILLPFLVVFIPGSEIKHQLERSLDLALKSVPNTII